MGARAIDLSASSLINDNSALKDFYRVHLKQGDLPYARDPSTMTYSGIPMPKREGSVH